MDINMQSKLQKKGKNVGKTEIMFQDNKLFLTTC